MLSILAIVLACATGESEVPSVTTDVVRSTATSIRDCLTEAAELRKQGRRLASRDAVLGCYRAHFEPIEPVMRSHARRATLSLEYGFGRVARTMAREGTAETAASVAEQLADRVEGVLETIPVAPAPSSTAADTGMTVP